MTDIPGLTVKLRMRFDRPKEYAGSVAKSNLEFETVTSIHEFGSSGIPRRPFVASENPMLNVTRSLPMLESTKTSED
jgi:hypothetical protein